MHLADSQPYLLSYALEPCSAAAAFPSSGEQVPECESIFGQATTRNDAVDYIQRTVPHDTVVMAGVPLFYPLRDFWNFLSYRDGSVYGAELRNESMLAFWRRVEPRVVLLDEDFVASDDELTQYMDEHEFVRIMPGLWISEDLHTSLVPGTEALGPGD
jgi:hypothetical protein